jgi:homoserine kinase
MTFAGGVRGGWPSVVGRRLVVDVPASTANLGAGYDCLGLALELLNRVTVEGVEGDGSIELTTTGEGAGELRGDRSNRFVTGLEMALEALFEESRPVSIGWRISAHNRIPLSRGLGSSSAAAVGGLAAGNALGGGGLPMDVLLRMATGIEGHPDNASAVLLGGFVVSAHLGERVEAVRFDAPDGLRAVLFIPDRRLSTADMRRVLPAEVPLRDAVSNLSRVAIGVAGIASGRFDLLADLTVDRIHEPYRSVAYPQLPRLTGAARAAGALGAFLSGAGSTVLAFVAPGADASPVEAALRGAASAVGLDGRTAIVAPRNRGPEIVEGA